MAESILLAVKASRERGKKERGVTQPNVVLPTSAHAAFEKACYYFGLESRRVAVSEDWRANPEAMAAAVDDNTVLLVGSAPQYPQGVVDPIEAIAAIAAERDINCHVDGCMGGVSLTYLKRLGYTIPAWNFEVPGVTSISVDLHKYGYTAKGASVIAWRNKQLRSYQTYVTDNWLGGMYGSSGIMGTKGGGSMAAAWAVMNFLGDEGYMRVTLAARRAAEELVAGVLARPQLQLVAPPDSTLVSFRAADPAALDVFAIADGLWKRGWYLDRQGPPPALHCTVTQFTTARSLRFWPTSTPCSMNSADLQFPALKARTAPSNSSQTPCMGAVWDSSCLKSRPCGHWGRRQQGRMWHASCCVSPC